MFKDIARKWTAALRSGKYRKTQGILCKVDKYGNKSHCCLGVLTELYNKEHKNEKVNVFGGASLDFKVVKWAGMNDGFGYIRGASEVERDSLIKINDCKRSRHSFKRIADIIEKNVENL